MSEQNKTEEITLEEAFARLDQILEQLSDKEVSLDQCFSSYEEGMRLLRSCNEHLDRVEKQMLVLNEEGTTDEF